MSLESGAVCQPNTGDSDVRQSENLLATVGFLKGVSEGEQCIQEDSASDHEHDFDSDLLSSIKDGTQDIFCSTGGELRIILCAHRYPLQSAMKTHLTKCSTLFLSQNVSS